MGWNYRILRTSHPEGQVTYSIHEVYYSKDGTIVGWTQDPSEAYGETVEELRKTLEMMGQALDHTVIEVNHEAVQDRCGND